MRRIVGGGLTQVWAASMAAPGGRENEDHAFRYANLVGVLDGATVPDSFDTGCVHGPAWYVRRLAARICLAAADRPEAALTGNLAAAILAVRADHGDRCDLDHPGTPSSTVCLLRDNRDHIEYLVLCDSPLILDQDGEVRAVTDDRLRSAMADLRVTASALPERKTAAGAGAGGLANPGARFRDAVALQRRQMNQTHGYWVAAADPDAAFHAVTGALPLTGPRSVRRAALLSDGAARAVETLGLYDWSGLLDLLSRAGPAELIRQVRAAEAAGSAPHPDGGPKRHDDATAVLCEFGPVDG